VNKEGLTSAWVPSAVLEVYLHTWIRKVWSASFFFHKILYWCDSAWGRPLVGDENLQDFNMTVFHWSYCFHDIEKCRPKWCLEEVKTKTMFCQCRGSGGNWGCLALVAFIFVDHVSVFIIVSFLVAIYASVMVVYDSLNNWLQCCIGSLSSYVNKEGLVGLIFCKSFKSISIPSLVGNLTIIVVFLVFLKTRTWSLIHWIGLTFAH
jgi:hypothetical protein